MQAKNIHNGSDNGDKCQNKIYEFKLIIFALKKDQFFHNLNKSADTVSSKNNEINLSSENIWYNIHMLK